VIAVLLALAAAVSYGGSDYAAGLAARGADVVPVTLAVQLTYAIVIISAVPLITSVSASVSAIIWGAAAGTASVVAAIALYLGFRHAAFSLVSTVSAVSSAVFSVLAGLLLGERPALPSLVGIMIALPAIAAISAGGQGRPDQPEAPRRRRGSTGSRLTGVICALVAGAGFGLFFICLNQVRPSADLWPLAVAALAGLVVVTFAAAVTRQLRPPQAGTRWLALLSGITAAAGSFSYFFATHRGPLAVTAVITSLYPAGTIVLARLLLGERLNRTQIVGLCLAAASVSLIAVAG
jgi:drug/metabolite transporter (DMT)-like permease